MKKNLQSEDVSCTKEQKKTQNKYGLLEKEQGEGLTY